MSFWLIMVFATIATACFLNMLYRSIQPGQWLDGWQKQLRQWDLAGKQVLFKMLGGCPLCTFNTLSQITMIVLTVGMFLTGWFTGYQSIFSYLVFTPITVILSLFIYNRI